MPLVGASLVPHTPLLLPTVGKEYQRQTRRTRQALQTVAQELYALKPDALLVIHSHGPAIEEAFLLNVSEKFTADLTEFGDMVTVGEWRGSPMLSHHLKEQAENRGFPLVLSHEPKISYDVSVPLLLIAEKLTTCAVTPLTTSSLDARTQVDFGRLLAEEFHARRQRIAVIVSAELSQHTTAGAPGGLRPEGPAFDRMVIKSLPKKGLAELLLGLDPVLTEQAEACGYRPLLVLAGLLARQNAHTKKLAYESPFGIGLLTAQFHIA